MRVTGALKTSRALGAIQADVQTSAMIPSPGRLDRRGRARYEEMRPVGSYTDEAPDHEVELMAKKKSSTRASVSKRREPAASSTRAIHRAASASAKAESNPKPKLSFLSADVAIARLAERRAALAAAIGEEPA